MNTSLFFIRLIYPNKEYMEYKCLSEADRDDWMKEFEVYLCEDRRHNTWLIDPITLATKKRHSNTLYFEQVNLDHVDIIQSGLLDDEECKECFKGKKVDK
jgi:hypothetical protein